MDECTTCGEELECMLVMGWPVPVCPSGCDEHGPDDDGDHESRMERMYGPRDE